MKLLLFDIDGTILSTNGAGSRAASRAFERMHGIKDAMEKVNAAGKTDPLIFGEVFRNELGRDNTPEEEAQVYGYYVEYLQEEIKTAEIDVKPGVRELLNNLSGREDILLGLGTGNIEKGARIKLGQAGLNGHFKFGGFGCDAEHREEVIRRAIERAHEHKTSEATFSETYVIGDTPLDIIHGRAAGARIVAVATGYYSIEELREHDPDYLYEDFGDTESVVRIFS